MANEVASLVLSYLSPTGNYRHFIVLGWSCSHPYPTLRTCSKKAISIVGANNDVRMSFWDGDCAISGRQTRQVDHVFYLENWDKTETIFTLQNSTSMLKKEIVEVLHILNRENKERIEGPHSDSTVFEVARKLKSR